jgi:hypothetical protein
VAYRIYHLWGLLVLTYFEEAVSYASFLSIIRDDGNYLKQVVYKNQACIYGPIQFMRIVTQDRFWGILDQWFTLPFFAVVTAWSIQYIFRFDSIIFTLSILSISVLSYLSAVFHPLGFEFTLG